VYTCFIHRAHCFHRACIYIYIYIWILFRVCKGGALFWYVYRALLWIRILYTGLIGLVYIYIYIYIYIDLVSCM